MCVNVDLNLNGQTFIPGLYLHFKVSVSPVSTDQQGLTIFHTVKKNCLFEPLLIKMRTA